MSGYWYIQGSDGKQFCWAREPTFRCRYSEQAPSKLSDAAVALGLSNLDELFKRAHQRGSIRKRDPKTNRLTNRCQACGAKLVRRGFAYWVERPPTAKDSGEQQVSARISNRLGGTGLVREETHYADTKREAETWARESASAIDRPEKEQR